MQETGPYILVAKLGEGGMAEVFKAVKRGPDGFEKPIALKRILPHLADNHSFIKMLSAEARLAAQLDHPNLVHVFDFFTEGNTFFIALEYVAGHNLRKLMNDARTRKQDLPWPAAVHIILELLKGLDFAHKRQGPNGPLGIIHRDVSPQNVLVSFGGMVKLSDFGIARANIEREVTESGVLKGKQRYLSPEQLESKSMDHRSDLFSAATVLYELLAGVHPFEAATDFETMKRISKGDFIPIANRCPSLPEKIASTVDLALNTDPSKRPQDGSLFRAELHEGQDQVWLKNGSEHLAEWMALLYPKGSADSEMPIERTPLLVKKEGSLPIKIEPTQSFISGVAEISLSSLYRKASEKRPKAGWFVAIAFLAAGAAGVWKILVRPPVETPMPEVVPIVGPETPSTVSSPEVTLKEIVELASPPTPKTKTVEGVPAKKIKIAPKAALGKPGFLAVEGPTGAQVYINGKFEGRIPFQGRTLQTGVYSIVIAPKGLPPMMARTDIVSGRKNTIKWSAPAPR